MKKIFKALPAALIIASTVTASAYNVVNLPESMTLSDAMEIFGSSEIERMTVSDVFDGRYTQLNREEIDTFFDIAKNLKVYRTINPTPFRGISVNIYTSDGSKSYLLNSGIEIGSYGDNSYICYKLNDADTEKLLYLDDRYWDDSNKSGGEFVHRLVQRDFLKLPEAMWSRSFVIEAARKHLLPYDFTRSYSDNITREQFCRLIGNFIAVKDNYASLEDYMSDAGGAYLRNYFEDCQGADNSINILYALGVVNGKDETHFDPHGVITREEAATLLSKTADLYWDLETNSPVTYSDKNSISEWARPYVNWVTHYNIMTGVNEKEFAPKGYYTVEQAVATIVRLYNLLV